MVFKSVCFIPFCVETLLEDKIQNGISKESKIKMINIMFQIKMELFHFVLKHH